VMRGREFLMKDAYSFHADEASLAEGYAVMKAAYTRMFTRMQLGFRSVRADTGSIGGTASEEFQVLADSGEDAVAVGDADDFAANLEMAAALPPATPRGEPSRAMEQVPTPGAKTIAQVAELLKVEPARCVKTLLVDGDDGSVVALVLRGDHELNAVKTQKLAGIASPLRLATPERVRAVAGTEPGYIGPVGLGVRVIADHSALALADFVCGANVADAHLQGVNWDRDVPAPEAADLRNVVDGDPSPSGRGTLRIVRGIEVGHIFQLGRKYSEAMKASVLDTAGKPQLMWMGCYGIGISRIVAAAIEQNHDDKGIVWPDALAPFQVVVVPLNAARSPAVQEAAEKLYAGLTAAGIETLIDDRDARPGVKFADAELLGIPHCVVVGDRGLAQGKLEYRHRRSGTTGELPADAAIEALRERMAPAA
jgi:prolyl-tRNA synthetase